MSNAVRLTVVPEAAQVALGEQLSLAVTVRHTGPSRAHYRLDISGIPADWYTLDRPYFALQPAASAQILVTVHPPARPVTIAGRYTLTVQVRAAEDPHLTAAAVALTLWTSGGVDMDVQPAEAVGPTGVFHVTFLNQMTWPVDVALTAHDAENALHFRIEPENPVVVPATGVAGPLTVHVAPRVPELVAEPHPYEIEFRSVDLSSLQRNEQRVRFVYVPRDPTGRLPVWLRWAPGRAGLYSLLLLLLLLLLLVVVGSRALAHPATRPAATPPPTPTRAVSRVPPTRPRATAQALVPIPSIDRFTLVHSGRGQPYVLVWQTRGASQVTLNGRPVATRDRVALRAPLHSAIYRLVATSGARGATASLGLVVDGHTPDRHAFVLTTPEIATFAVLRRKGQLEAIWRVRDAVHVWLQGRLVSSTGAARVPTGASWLRLVASNDVGSRQRLLHLVRLVPPATPRPRPTATPTARPTATPVPPPTRTLVVRAAATPRPTATPTARPPRTPTPVSVTVGTTRPPAVPTPRPSATPTPVSVTIGTAAPPSRRRLPQAR